MKVIVALCVVFALAQAAHQTYWYSGSVNTTGTPYANPVDTSVTTGCATLGYQSGYRNFTVNVTANGFFYFTALFERVFKSSAQVQVYSSTYNPVNSCANLIYAVKGQGEVPHIEFLQYLTVGIYQVVITGSDNSSLGLFSIHVDVATLNGATDEFTSNWWTSPSSQSDGDRAICEDGNNNAPFTSFSFYQNGTINADILVFGYNSTTTNSWGLSAAVYNSATLNFTSTGNQTNPVSGCTTPYFVYGFGSSFSDLDFNLQNSVAYTAGAGLGITLRNGTTYTVVVGSYASSNAYTSKFGVFMRESLLSTLTNRTFTDVPTITGLGTNSVCVPTTSDVYFGVNTFTAQYSAYILDNPRSGFFDTTGCLYYGINTGNGTASPISCPGNTSSIAFIQCGDTGDGGPVANFLVAGYNYTWIQMQYNSVGTPGAPYLLYNYSGKQLGSGPITTTAAPTTGSTSAMEVSSSSASTVVVMLSLYIAAMFF